MPTALPHLQAAELLVSSQLDPLPATPALLRAALPAKGAAFQNRLAPIPGHSNGYGHVVRRSLRLDQRCSPPPNSTRSLSTCPPSATARSSSRRTSRACSPAQSHGHHDEHRRSQCAAHAGHVRRLAGRPGGGPHGRRQGALRATISDHPRVHRLRRARRPSGPTRSTASTPGDLFTYLTTTLKIDFPVDEWFYGAARVRPALRYLGVGAHVGFGIRSDAARAHSGAISLRRGCAVACPAISHDTYTIDSDRLLYTCIYREPFNPPAANAAC